MSTQDADRLLEALRTNTSLKEKLKKAGRSGFERTAADAGFQVTREEFANAVKAMVVKADLAGPHGFEVADGVVSGVASATSGHVGGVVSGIA